MLADIINAFAEVFMTCRYRHFIIFFYIMIVFILNMNSCKKNEISKAYVISDNGLNLRERPSLESKKLLAIPYKHEVIIIKSWIILK